MAIESDFKPSTSESDEFGVVSLLRVIAAGQLTFRQFRQWLSGIPVHQRDLAVDALLELDPWESDGPELPRGCVPYLPTPVHVLEQLLRQVPLSSRSRFVDIGCGVGRAALFAHLFSGARVSGIEVQSHLVVRARAASQRINARGAQFVHGDVTALTQPLPAADVYFMYCPFGVDRLNPVLEHIDQATRGSAVVVACVQMPEIVCDWLTPLPSELTDLRCYRRGRERG